MDTVWIKLTVLPASKINLPYEEVFMFGPNGINKFTPSEDNKGVMLFTNMTTHVATVEESIEGIMLTLRLMRKTIGRSDGKQKSKKNARKTKTR